MASLAVLILPLMTTFLCFMVSLAAGQLSVGFYSKTCPNAEQFVTSVVKQSILSDPNMAAVLLRLHFHDCFVEGCDGSILIEGDGAEKGAFGHQGVGGFEVIQQAKLLLERTCPGVVSCADIVAMAARDAVAMSRGPVYQVETGRRDGRVSNIKLAKDMPEVTESILQLKDKFLKKGLSQKDLVVLSGAHTIGTTACFFMTHRLYNFSATDGGSDPTISPLFLPQLKATCPKNGDINVRLPMDHGSERIFDTQIFRNIRNGFAVLESDAKLYTDAETKRIVDSYVGFLGVLGPSLFATDFAAAMVKMGRIGVQTASQGEIRKVCKAFN